MRYEFFDHTADMMFKAYGDTLEERFINSAYAMWSIIAEIEKVAPKIKKSIELEAVDIKALLYNFLEHFLIELDSEGFLLSKIEKLDINFDGKKYILKSIFYGDHLEDYETLEHVKAVTYNSMEINDDFVQVVLDL